MVIEEQLVNLKKKRLKLSIIYIKMNIYIRFQLNLKKFLVLIIIITLLKIMKFYQLLNRLNGKCIMNIWDVTFIIMIIFFINKIEKFYLTKKIKT